MTPTFIKSLPAGAEIGGYLIAAFTGDGKTVAAADGATAKIAGISDAMGADSDGMVDLVQGGWAEVRAGGTFDAGDPLTSDATGRAVLATAVAGQTVRVIATAMADAVEDDIVPVWITPAFIHTPAA